MATVKQYKIVTGKSSGWKVIKKGNEVYYGISCTLTYGTLIVREHLLAKYHGLQHLFLLGHCGLAQTVMKTVTQVGLAKLCFLNLWVAVPTHFLHVVK